MHTGKTLIAEVEREYRLEIEKNRQFKLPNYRSGDVIDVTMFRSLSEGKFNKYRGIVIGSKNPHSLNKSFTVHFNEAEMNLSMMIKAYSPMVAKVDIFKYGSNELRKKLSYVPDLELSKNRLNEPITKGKGFRVRGTRRVQRRIETKDKDSGKVKRESIKLESPYET
jgi:ribosomal protein L19